MRAIVSVLLGLVVCVSAFAQSAQQQERERLEFQQRARTLGDAISADNPRESARCKELRQEIELYKGKPQRRYTARRNYEAECMREEVNPDGVSSAPFTQ